MKYIKNNWLILLVGMFFITFSILFPELEITMSGGFAWFVVMMSYLIGGTMIYCGIFGGEVSFSSKGLIPQVKEYVKRRNENNES